MTTEDNDSEQEKAALATRMFLVTATRIAEGDVSAAMQHEAAMVGREIRFVTFHHQDVPMGNTGMRQTVSTLIYEYDALGVGAKVFIKRRLSVFVEGRCVSSVCM